MGLLGSGGLGWLRAVRCEGSLDNGLVLETDLYTALRFTLSWEMRRGKWRAVRSASSMVDRHNCWTWRTCPETVDCMKEHTLGQRHGEGSRRDELAA